MEEHPPMRVAGNAFLWQAFQMGGVKALYMIRLLVLAALLTPDDFGLIAIALSATGLLIGLTSIGIIPAAVQAQDMDDARYDAVWTLHVTRSSIVTLLTVLLAPLLAKIFAEPRAVLIIQMVAFRPFLESLVSVKVVALNRSLTFRPLAFLKIIEAFFNMLVSILLARFLGVWAMVLGMLAGATSMLIASYILAPHRPRIIFDWHALKPLLSFGSWLMVTDAIAMLGSFGIRTIISRLVGAEGLGLYFLAVQIAFIPNEIADEVVGTVAFPLFSRIKSSLHQAAHAFQTILTGMVALLYPVSALIIVLSPGLVQNFLGKKWEGTVLLIQILALVAMINLFSEATFPLVKGFGLPKRAMQLELFRSGSLIGMMWFFTSTWGITGSALAWLPVAVVTQMLCLHFVHEIFHARLGEIRKSLIAISMATLAGAGIAYLVIHAWPGIPGLVIAGLLAVVVTASSLWFLDRRYSLGLLVNVETAFPQVASLLKIGNINLS